MVCEGNCNEETKVALIISVIVLFGGWLAGLVLL